MNRVLSMVELKLLHILSMYAQLSDFFGEEITRV